MAGNSNYATPLLSTTLVNMMPKVVDNIFDSLALLYFLKKKGRYKLLDGGSKIVVPLMYGTNGTAGSYSDYDPIDTTPQQGLSAAEYDWREYAVTVSISQREELLNKGESAAANLLEAKVKQAEMSLINTLNTQINATTQTGNNVWSLIDAIQTDPTSNPGSGAFGNIPTSSSQNTWWKNVTATAKLSSTAYDRLISQMVVVYNQCALAGGGKNMKPDFAVTDSTTFSGYESELQERHRIVDNGTADAGFENLKFKGAVVFLDEAAPSAAVRFVNTQLCYLAAHQDNNFKTHDFQEPITQTAKIAKITWMGNLVVDRRDKLGVVHSIT